MIFDRVLNRPLKCPHICNLREKYPYTQIYNLIFVPQVTRFLLEDTIISCKTNWCSGSTKLKIESNGYIRKNKTKSVIFSFISTFYLKQQTNIPRCFCSIKFENNLFSNKLYKRIFRSERKVYTAENDQIKYFVQN